MSAPLFDLDQESSSASIYLFLPKSTKLAVAARHNNEGLVASLLSKNPRIATEERLEERAALNWATYHYYKPMIQALAVYCKPDSNIHAADADQQTPLCWTVFGNKEVAEALI
jgi:hypothetical protein